MMDPRMKKKRKLLEELWRRVLLPTVLFQFFGLNENIPKNNPRLVFVHLTTKIAGVITKIHPVF